jgi:predicted  nucleic acid-binding Zn-ribbon protein
MIPKGFVLMIKSLLPALGIKINPDAVEAQFAYLTKAIPELVQFAHAKLESIDSRLLAIEERLQALEMQVSLISIAISAATTSDDKKPRSSELVKQ